MMDMQHTVRREAVRAAVMRAIFCPIGKQVLDIDSAFLISDKLDGSTCVVGGQTWAKILPGLTVEQLRLLEVWRGSDGAELTVEQLLDLQVVGRHQSAPGGGA